MIICGTGHRPNKLGGYAAKVHDMQCQILHDYFDSAPLPDKIISGMALGWDTSLATVALMKGVPLVAAVPFYGQEGAWPDASRRTFHHLLEQAAKVVYISEGGYAPWKMQVRNKWMVDHCDSVLALWDGTDGGTANCVRYAQSVDKPIVNLWDSFERIREQG